MSLSGFGSCAVPICGTIGLASGTVKSYLAVVRYAHIHVGLGLGDPHMSEMPLL